jgi:hypothetical protein
MYGPTAAVTHIRTSSGQLKIILWTNLDEANIVRGIDRTSSKREESSCWAEN